MAIRTLSSRLFPNYVPALRAATRHNYITRNYASKKFTEEHEWVSVEIDVATIGITNYAQNALGDVVFIEAPEVDKTVKKGDVIGVVESVKAASDIYAPVSGTVIEGNQALENDATLINNSPEAEGWLCKIRLSNPSELDELWDEDKYKAHIQGM